MDSTLEIMHLNSLFRLVKTTMHFFKYYSTKIRQNGLINVVFSNSTVAF